jgi:hypothetical protein
VQLAAGAFILRKIYREMFHWGQADRLAASVFVVALADRAPLGRRSGEKFTYLLGG